MRSEFQRPRGTQDILPPASYRMEQIRRIAIDTAAKFGYDLIETPIFEQTPVFLRVGESTDIVQHERYSFTDAGGVDLTLRPEGTAAIARAYVEHGMFNQPQPVRMCYYGPMFRRERPQALRYRQHTQFGAELYGSIQPEADAEVILLACDVVEQVGLKNPVIRLNSIGCSQCRPSYRKSLIEYYQGRHQELCEDCQTRIHTNPLRLLDCKIDVEIRQQAPDIQDYWCEDCRAHYQQLTKLLTEAGRQVIRDPFLVRGLDYYTRTVFEIGHPSLGNQTALFGGGRYDGLATTLDGPEVTPAVGFGMGIERILSAVEENFPLPPKRSVYVAHLPGFEDAAFVLAENLRQQGFSAESDLLRRSLKAQLRDANRRSTVVVIVGGKEWEQGQVAVKRLGESEQLTIHQDQLSEFLRQELTPNP
ncbi:MAG: histidine--tRNA ligase [Sulfobacillus thermosulfidooxidans]|uniref:Histidine--tRNA ligase n=1 Tax=Sulfobacillus thermosulfidooxidans TaxID=28034 RepID=A0A2T2X4A9_SULTH|nr:MAG: histidine--tRNA ligase [Sulfobacillus thermosulfidooxidans]